MSKTINAMFQTRRDAEMAIERLVQELGVERTDVFVAAEGRDNSAGPIRAGSDDDDGASGAREDGAHAGSIMLSVDINEEDLAEKVSIAIKEFDGVEA